ncbi:hypothetical protein BB559_000144 [Furculomyces boomerangus]|uniref:Rab-GAP TBC domain-containing protein n=2 Tax=Harpellales TaxID=61421 RepID=A0A2T9Z691_9FUNG|nr:hypothetical protein BB559_000144 [Furculomyces boomerangus]PVZ99690.1 hypothetical protein BB558_004280 [Smittium angustum]PWA03359.1 hypothetical protein BB558_000487 [Smittium angustum]
MYNNIPTAVIDLYSNILIHSENSNFRDSESIAPKTPVTIRNTQNIPPSNLSSAKTTDQPYNPLTDYSSNLSSAETNTNISLDFSHFNQTIQNDHPNFSNQPKNKQNLFSPNNQKTEHNSKLNIDSSIQNLYLEFDKNEIYDYPEMKKTTPKTNGYRNSIHNRMNLPLSTNQENYSHPTLINGLSSNKKPSTTQNLNNQKPFSNKKSEKNFNRRSSNVYSISNLAYLASKKNKIVDSGIPLSVGLERTIENAAIINDYLETQKQNVQFQREMILSRDKYLEKTSPKIAPTTVLTNKNSNQYDNSSVLSKKNPSNTVLKNRLFENLRLNKAPSKNNPYKPPKSSYSTYPDSSPVPPHINELVSTSSETHTNILEISNLSPNISSDPFARNSTISGNTPQTRKGLGIGFSDYKDPATQNDNTSNSGEVDKAVDLYDYRVSRYLSEKFLNLDTNLSIDPKTTKNETTSPGNLLSHNQSQNLDKLSEKDYTWEKISNNHISSDVIFASNKVQSTITNILLRAGLSSVALRMAQSNMKRGNNRTASLYSISSVIKTPNAGFSPSLRITGSQSSAKLNDIANNFIRNIPTNKDGEKESNISPKTSELPILQKSLLNYNPTNENVNTFESPKVNNTISEMKGMRLFFVDSLDEYGFLIFRDKKNNKDSNNHAPMLSLARKNSLDPHGITLVDKWNTILAMFSSESILKSKKFQKLAMEGFPDQMRAQIYWSLLGIKNNYSKLLNGVSLFGEYENLHFSMNDEKLREVIERDIPRSFPNHSLFYDESCGGQDSLRNILLAYAHYNPEVGYCQGMNQLAGFLMIVGIPETEAFWTLAAILDTHLLNFFTPSLSQLRVHAAVFELLLKDHNHKLFSHLAAQCCEPLMYVTPWFMTVFTMSLPWKSVLRVWDWFIFRGGKVLYRVALGIMDICSEYLLTSCPTLDRQLDLLLHIPQEWLGPDQVINAASKVSITSKQISKHTNSVLRRENPESK